MINATEFALGLRKGHFYFDLEHGRLWIGLKTEQKKWSEKKMNQIKLWIPKIADYVVINSE